MSWSPYVKILVTVGINLGNLMFFVEAYRLTSNRSCSDDFSRCTWTSAYRHIAGHYSNALAFSRIQNTVLITTDQVPIYILGWREAQIVETLQFTQ